VRAASLKSRTRDKILRFVAQFLEDKARTLPQWEIDDLKRAYPFYPLFLSDEELLGFKKERSLTTKFGQGFYPQLARLIAEDEYQDVKLEHEVRGNLNSAAYEMLEQIVTELRHKQRGPDRETEMRDILSSRGGGISERVAVCDLFVGDFRSGPLCIELKGPQPNLDTASGAKRNMLYFLSIMHRNGHDDADAFLGFYYNPWIDRELYKHWATKQIMDMDREVLMGAELWDYLGGQGTFAEMIPILERARVKVFGK
jgi:type II restriction enzyme